MEEIQKGEGNDKHPAYDLKVFNSEWIEKAGLNEIQAIWDPTKKGKQTVTFKQTAFMKEHPTLRYHKMKVGFFDKDCNVIHSHDLIVDNKEET